jgi:hypothetical protein
MQTNDNFRIRIIDGKKKIFDPIRKAYVAFTPEEMVRQAYLKYLINELHIPEIAISVEKKVVYNSLTKRYDIVVAKPDGSVLLAVECKAESIEINENTLHQLAMYNRELQAKYLVLYNGKEQVVLKQNKLDYLRIEELPSYKEMIGSV